MRQLIRGAQLRELLKQVQAQPLSVVQQVAIIYTGTRTLRRESVTNVMVPRIAYGRRIRDPFYWADFLLEECPKHEGYLDCGPLHPYCPTREAVDR